ncbi:MAG: nucleotidyltransferase [Anaerolineae bacterium]|nr:nucleotidyltransferase [Anaerolineae bacterium]
MSHPALVVMAAGMGSRYGGLKQLDPVGPSGEIILDYSVYDALRAGFGRVVFVIKAEIEDAFREKVGRTIEGQCEVAYVFQRLDDVPEGFAVPPGRAKPWGTAHATYSARHVVDVPFAVINADDFYGRSSFQVLHDHLRTARDGNVHDYSMVGFKLENTLTEHGHVSRGVCTVDAEGYLQEVRERTRIQRSGDRIVYTEDGENWTEISREATASMNMWGFTPSLFSELETRFRSFLQENVDRLLKAEFFLPDFVGRLTKEDRAQVKVLPTDERWFGVTYREDKPRVEQAVLDLIRQGIYPHNLWG